MAWSSRGRQLGRGGLKRLGEHAWVKQGRQTGEQNTGAKTAEWEGEGTSGGLGQAQGASGGFRESGPGRVFLVS